MIYEITEIRYFDSTLSKTIRKPIIPKYFYGDKERIDFIKQWSNRLGSTVYATYRGIPNEKFLEYMHSRQIPFTGRMSRLLGELGKSPQNKSL